MGDIVKEERPRLFLFFDSREALGQFVIQSLFGRLHLLLHTVDITGQAEGKQRDFHGRTSDHAPLREQRRAEIADIRKDGKEIADHKKAPGKEENLSLWNTLAYRSCSSKNNPQSDGNICDDNDERRILIPPRGQEKRDQSQADQKVSGIMQSLRMAFELQKKS